jgi:hypothetical protein
MGLFNIFKRTERQPADERLLGRWALARSEQDLDTGESVVAEFTPDGRLEYSITKGGQTGIMKMVYRVDGGVLITDQPSSPQEERTNYSFEAEGLLVLDYGGQRSWFRRVA